MEKRITSRYIDPTDKLLHEDSQRSATERRFGFTILAIDCLLIETFQAFIEGKLDTTSVSGLMFENFLTKRQSFKVHFTKAIAEQFYKEFRCGILHQAEIQGTSLVWSVGALVWFQQGTMIVNRSEFHSLLKHEFGAYLGELRDLNNSQLRQNFRKKMDHVSRK